MKTPSKRLPFVEFVTLLALMISIVAMATDIKLPALSQIGHDLKVADPNHVQLIVSALFLGFAVGQVVAGPVSDSIGRKPVIYIGYAVFLFGCLLSLFATDITVMLIGRVFQGLGAACPRIITLALVRDEYEGRAMARIMSITMAVFILVPAIAPAIGQGVILVSNWHMTFVLLMAMAIVSVLWFAIRQPETLAKADRRRFSVSNIVGGVREALGYRAAVGYTLAAGCVFGAFLGYLSSAQQVFQTGFGVGELFPLFFGAAALTIGLASIFNSRLVMRLGMRYLTWRAVMAMTVLSCLFLVPVVLLDGLPPLWSFMIWLLATFFCVGIMFGNFNAMAMEPLGHMAGLGAALVGSGSAFMSLPLGWAVGAAFNGGALPLVAGFAVLGAASMSIMFFTERGLAR
ncbi:MAG: multidrug effflux MFS transporter [Alphaproteobacteria bacterium]